MLPSTSLLSAALAGGESDNQAIPHSTTNRSILVQQSPKSTVSYSGRRKQSLSYQQKLQIITAAGVEGIIKGGGTTSPNLYNQHTNETFLHAYHHHANISRDPMDRFDESINCCLPPPSPAPTSDRFMMSLPSPISTTDFRTYNHFSNAEAVSTTTEKPSISKPIGPSSPMPTSSNTSLNNVNNNSTQQFQPVTTNPSGLLMSHKISSSNSVSTLQRSLSPNSRFRLSDRFRENASSTPEPTSRFGSNSHFFSQNSPVVPCDAYTYLSSAVHTPVKRYVPTPPPPTELYSDIPISLQQPQLVAGGVVPKSNSMHQQLPLPVQQSTQRPTNNVSTLPYRFRMKCCANESPQQQLPTWHSLEQHEPRGGNMPQVDCYATSPREQTYKCSNNGSSVSPSAPNNFSIKNLSNMTFKNENQFSNTQAKPCSPSVASATTSSTILIDSSLSETSALSPTITGVVSETPSIEYINTLLSTNGNGVPGRVISPERVIISNVGDSNGSASTGTCLHCSTVRRTTGVHQTTQTTGPISPVPLQQLTNNAIYSNSYNANIELASSTSTPSTTDSHSSSVSPLTTQQQHKSYHQQKVKNDQEDKIVTDQRKEVYNPQQYYRQQQHRQQFISTQINLLDRSNPVNCGQQQQQPQHQLHGENHSVQSDHFHQQSPQQLQQAHQVLPMQQQLQLQQRYSRKQRISQYIRKEIAKFFGVDMESESEERAKWLGRQRRMALRRFGVLRLEREINANFGNDANGNPDYFADSAGGMRSQPRMHSSQNGAHHNHYHATDRPDILPAHDTENTELPTSGCKSSINRRRHYINTNFHLGDHVERKASVPDMLLFGIINIMQRLNKRYSRQRRQWSRSFAPAHIKMTNGGANPSDICEGLTTLQEEEVFFDSPGNESMCGMASTNSATSMSPASSVRNATTVSTKIIENQRQLYMGERLHGWQTSAIINNIQPSEQLAAPIQKQQHHMPSITVQQQQSLIHQHHAQQQNNMRGNRIASTILDGVLENSRRPIVKRVKLFSIKDLDDRHDHRPFFTYWINTVQILVLFLSLICYGIGPIGFGIEQKTGQVLVTSLSLQTVQHQEQQNVWIGPRNSDLVHMGAKFAACMRRDVKIIDVLEKTRRKERETACCIRNDDSGCVQSSQADCSVRGLFPTKSISTWKKWSPGESGPGGRISGSVCGLDPKYCDAPASIAPYEWPDDITKWPICRKTNSFSQRFRYKDHTAEHMVCEVIGHPCCTGVFGECRITTKEYCDFVNGYFHEEASLCSQISCLNNVCGMFPFFSIEIPDQFYRLFTSLCLHAGILHLAITVTFQHIFLADLERLIGPIRTAIVYIGSGLAGNLTSAVLVPYKPEVGPLASLSGVIASLVALLILIHWKQLYKPHVALLKLIFIFFLLFGIGTLPWQLNFVGLLAGIFCGIFLTVALVPFVGVTKYRRKAKINLIWSCILFHMFIYTLMLLIFYIYPTELRNLNFGEVLSGGANSNIVNLGGIERFGNNVMTSSSNKNHHQEQKQQQFNHHHHSDDIISNSGLNERENAGRYIKPSELQIYFSQNYHNVHTNGVSNSGQNLAYRNMELYLYSTYNYNVTGGIKSTTSLSKYQLPNNDIFISNKNNTSIDYYDNELDNKLAMNTYNTINSKGYYNLNNSNRMRSGKPISRTTSNKIFKGDAIFPLQQPSTNNAHSMTRNNINHSTQDKTTVFNVNNIRIVEEKRSLLQPSVDAIEELIQGSIVPKVEGRPYLDILLSTTQRSNNSTPEAGRSTN